MLQEHDKSKKNGVLKPEKIISLFPVICFELAITRRPWTFFDFPFMVQVIGIQLYYNNFENMPFRERSYLVDKKKVCIRVAKGLPTPLSLLPQTSKCLQVYHHNSFDCYENHSKYLTIIALGWAKYRDFSVASRSIICQSRRLRQIIDLQDTDKSGYFAKTEFNNCFIIRSPSLFF